MNQIEEGIIKILEARNKAIHIGTLAYFLDQHKYIEPYDYLWEYNSREGSEWWKEIYKAIKSLISQGKVGITGKKGSTLFLTERRRT